MNRLAYLKAELAQLRAVARTRPLTAVETRRMQVLVSALGDSIL
jgi:hypothetical protein